MKDTKFLYLIGIVGIVSWLAYFAAYASHYKTEYIVSGLIFSVVATVLYFVLVKSFTSGGAGRKLTATLLALVAIGMTGYIFIG